MTMFNLPEDVPLEHPMVSRAIQQAQVKVEGFHFDSRKHLVDYDDVLNKQREIVYRRRRRILEGERQREKILRDITNEITNVVAIYSSEKEGSYDREKITSEFSSIIPFDEASKQQLIGELDKIHTSQDMSQFLGKVALDLYDAREKQVTSDVMGQIERWVSLNVIDNLWMEHLDAIDDLREGIGLRGYGQRDPLVEYKNEAFSMFERLMLTIENDIVHRIYKVQVQMAPSEQASNAKAQMPNKTTELPKPVFQGSPLSGETKLSEAAKSARSAEASHTPVVNARKSLGRNDPCWCGSGKKWKKCHYPATS